MQSKLKLLIPGAILTLLALTSIQGYLIYNSYELQRKTYLTDARSAIASVYNSPQIDSTFWIYRNHFLDQLKPFLAGESSKTQLIDGLATKMDEINPAFVNHFASSLKNKDLGLKVNLKIIPSQIVLLDSLGAADTIYLGLPDSDMLLGTPFKAEEGILINNSSWRQDIDRIDANGKYIETLDFRTSVYMSIDNWESAMFRSMLGLFIAVFILLFSVVLLLLYSIKNLIKQKKLADIKTDFINNITHELKTPLSTLAIATKTLAVQNANAPLEQREQTLAIIERQNRRLHKLIDQVLNNSVGYQDLELSKESILCQEFLSNILNDYKLTLDKQVVLAIDIRLKDEHVNGDRFFLGTAIINILNNAVKYGGKQISVTANSEDGFLKIAISDNGIGISDKEKQLVFDKFYRVSQQNKHDYKGLGLGLFYCNQVVKAHYGRIELESKLGKGSTFLLFIPLKKSKS